MTYRIVREVYDRCGGKTRASEFEASNDKLALALVLENCMYGLNMSEEEFDNCTAEDLIEGIERCNGDGCDYIHLIENMDEGIVIYGYPDSVDVYVEYWDENSLVFDEEEEL